MKALLCSTALFISVAAFGQPQPPVGQAFTCTANAGTPVIVRVEGITELVGDLLLQCTGGNPTPLGVQVPLTNITVILNTGVTSRLLPNGTIESLLLIDEPKPGTQLGCVPSQEGGVPPSPGGVLPVPGQCNYLLGNGTGKGPYQYNVFQGLSTGPNSVTFAGIPIDPPGTNGVRIIRATNIRANANQLGATGALNPSITASVLMFPFVAVTNQPATVAIAQQGLAVGTPSTGSFLWCAGDNGGQIGTLNPDGSYNPGTFTLQFGEGYAGSFKPKGTGTNVPGAVPTSESGFVPAPSANLPAGIGMAGFGTRILLRFGGIGAGVRLVLPGVVPLTDTKGVSAGSVAITSSTGTTSGNNVMISPDPAGTIVANAEVETRDAANPNPVSFTLQITVNGNLISYQTPFHFQAIAGLFSPTYWQNNLFAPGSANLNGFPFFGGPGAGISSPPASSGLFLGSVIGSCTDTGDYPLPASRILSAVTGTLNSAATTPPAFINVIGPSTGTTAGPNLIAPPVSNVGIVSLSSATPGVTVTANPPAPWLNVGLSGTTTPLTAFLSVKNAAVGNYSTTLNFSAPGGLTLAVPVTYTATQGPWFTRYGFDNSASYVSDVVAPGEPFVIFGGDAFGPATLAGPALDANGLVTTTVGNTQVLFDGTPAPLYYSLNNNGLGQVAGFAPFELDTKTSTNVQVVYNGVKSPPVTIPVIDTAPGLYTADSSGGGQGAILNHDLSVNSASNPESVGNLIVLYGGGAGQTTPAGRDGGLAGVGAPLATLKLPVKVFIDGIAATVQYAGPAPSLVEGVFQINALIPAGVRHNMNVPVVVQVEDKQTQPGVTLATK